MTKNDKDELLWRLKDLPTGSEVAELVAQQVITKEEARDLLFTNKTRVELKQPEKMKEMADEIAFLRKLVDTLASTKSGGWNQTYIEYKRYVPAVPGNWWGTYGTVLASANEHYGSSTSSLALPVLSSIK